MLGRVNGLEVTDTPQSRQLYQVRNDSMVAAQPVSASTAGLFGPFLDQTLRMAPQAPGSVFEVSRSNLARRKPLDVEKEAKSLPTFAGDKQSKEEILLHNCLNFVQAVQDAVDRYEWQEADVFIAVASRFTGFASAWFRDWRLNHATNLTWRQLERSKRSRIHLISNSAQLQLQLRKKCCFRQLWNQSCRLLLCLGL
jgi:hypothetical protein